MFLSFFTNIVLMACFLGVSVGCLASVRRYSWMSAFIPLSLCAAASACCFLWAYQRFGQVMVDVGSQQSPQEIYFGAELRVKDFSKLVIPIELLAGYFFTVVALAFVGLGQEMGRRFATIEDRMLAYSVDILGSLTGIVVFGVMSFFRLPAYFWFAIAMSLASYFAPRRQWRHALGGPSSSCSSSGPTGARTRAARPWSSSGRLTIRFDSRRTIRRSTSIISAIK